MMQSALLAHWATSHSCAAAQPLTKTQLSFLWAKHDLVRHFFWPGKAACCTLHNSSLPRSTLKHG